MLHCSAVYRDVYMEQVGCSVVMLHCAAVYRGVCMEQVLCSLVMLHCAAVHTVCYCNDVYKD